MKEYQRCFHETKQEILENLGEKSFEVSEMYIFGKSEAFCRRLEKVSKLCVFIVSTEVRLLQRTVDEANLTLYALNRSAEEFFNFSFERSFDTSTE